MKATRYKIAVVLSLLSLPAMLLVANGGPAAAAQHRSATSARTAAVTSSSLGTFKPTFAGPAATGCSIDCHLLTGPLNTPSTAAAASGHRRSPARDPGRWTAHTPSRRRRISGPSISPRPNESGSLTAAPPSPSRR